MRSYVKHLLFLFLDERSRWFLWLPVGIGCGVVAYFSLSFEPSAYFLAATPALIALISISILSAERLPRAISALGVLAVLLCFAAGFNAAQTETLLAETRMMDFAIGPTEVEGRLMMAEPTADGARLTLKDLRIDRMDEGKIPSMVRIRVKKRADEMPAPGARVRLLAELRPFSDPVAPFAYDFRRQSFFKGLGGSGWSYGGVETVEEYSPHDVSWRDRFSLWMESLRRDLARRAAAATAGGDVAAITTALLTGEQSGIGAEAMQDMRASGLSHLLSISGIHVSMMGALVYFPLRALLALFPWVALRFSIKKWSAGAAIASTAAYTMLIGPQTPTLRSTLMTGIVMLAIIVDRRALSMRMVAISAAAVMLLYPDGLMGPSFQMSFAAVLAMVAAFEKPMDKALAEGSMDAAATASLGGGWTGRVLKPLAGIALTSLVATAATAPFTLYHFQNFSFYGVVANMLAVPLTSFVIMPCVLGTYIAAPFDLEEWFIIGAGWGVSLLTTIAHEIASWPMALLYLPAMPTAAFLVAIAGGLWICIWKGRWRAAGLIPLAIGMAYPLYSESPDAFISEDGKEWAVVLADGRMAVSGDDHDKFVPKQWRQRLGNPEAVELKDANPEIDGLRCDQQGCVYGKFGKSIAFPATVEAAWEDCRAAHAVLSPFFVADCRSEVIIDKESLREHGAHSLFFSHDGIEIWNSRGARGQRPWSLGWNGGQGERHR